MTSSTTRIITIALAILALAAPVAAAAPIRDGSPALARPNQRAHVYVIPASAFKQQPATTAPAHQAKPPVADTGDRSAHVYVIPASAFKQQPATTAAAHQAKPSVSGDSDPSPLVYILPSLALIAMFGAAAVYVRRLAPARADLTLQANPGAVSAAPGSSRGTLRVSVLEFGSSDR